jgi:hypothetical protein
MKYIPFTDLSSVVSPPVDDQRYLGGTNLVANSRWQHKSTDVTTTHVVNFYYTYFFSTLSQPANSLLALYEIHFNYLVLHKAQVARVLARQYRL